MNKVTLMGRLTKDPELRYTQQEKAFCKFTLAVNRAYKKDEADFINCVSFGKTAECIGKYLGKGRQIAVVGRIMTGNYEKDGQRIYTTDIVVDEMFFADSKKSETVSEADDTEFIANSDTDTELPF
jgi:single-strand DNA-binding protein